MSWSRRTPLVRSLSFGEVGVQRMDPPVAILKKKRPAVAVECAGRGQGRSVRPVVQEVGMIKNLKCNFMEDDDEEEDREGSFVTLGLVNYGESEDAGDDDYDDDKQSVDCSFGVFLKTCSFCKKRIRRNMDVFMYGYLKAFCSPECRDVQIEMDERLRPPSPEPSLLSAIAKMVEASNAAKITSSKSGLGSNVNNHLVSILD